MKVILLKNSGKLGKEGDAVTVKDGYARNFLTPQGVGLQANDNNFKRLQTLKRRQEKIVQKERQHYSELKGKIEKISLTITAEAKDDETLYGAIHEAQILKQLNAEGLTFNKDQIVLPAAITKLGVYNVSIKLFQDVEASLRVWVVKR